MIKRMSVLVLSLVALMSSACWAKSALVILKGTTGSQRVQVYQAVSELDPAWLFVSEDEYLMNLETDLWAQFFPRQYEQIAKAITYKNIYFAIRRHDITFKPDCAEPDKIRAHEAILFIRNYFNNHYSDYSNAKNRKYKELLVRDMKAAISLGHNVIIDGWWVPEEVVNELKDMVDIYTVIAYAPLPILLDRLAERNARAIESGDFRNKRHIDHVIRGFNDLYKLSPAAQKSIDKINRNALTDCLKRVDFCLSILAKPEGLAGLYHEMHLPDFRAMTKSWLDDCGDAQTLYIVPKIEYDYLVNTYEHSPQLCAQDIISFVASKK